MKFNKYLREHTLKYNKYINPNDWFAYKFIKKLIKKTVRQYPDFINTFPSYSDSESCCVCLDNENLMKTFCCHNYIHHKCMVHTLAFSTSGCPLCRSDIATAIKYDATYPREKFDGDIISIISHIHLNILRIENICKSKLITNSKMLKKYKQINYTAVIKICKKINKYLHIDVRQYFKDIILKNKILVS